MAEHLFYAHFIVQIFWTQSAVGRRLPHEVVEMGVTVGLRRHRGCCECGRLKHPDGAPHGRPVEPGRLAAVVRQQAKRGVSHGYCLECKRKLLTRMQAVV